MTTLTLSQEQLDAIADAQDDDPDLEDLTDVGVAKRLKADGHELFTGWGDEPKGEKPKAKRKARTRTSKAPAGRPVKSQRVPRAPKAAPEPVPAPEADGEVPELDTGEPAADAATEPQPEPAQRVRRSEVEKHLPAKAERHEVGTHHAAPLGGCGVEGLEGVDVSNLQTPNLKIKTPQTKDPHGLGIADVPDGHFFLSTDPTDFSDTRRLAFLDVRQGRSFMLEYEEEGRADQLHELGLGNVVPDEVNVVCSSNDRRLPVVRDDRDWEPFSSSCADCEFAEWKTSANTGKRVPPPCGENFRAVVVDLETMSPARMFFKGSAIRPVRGLLTKLAIAARRYKTGTYGVEVEVGTRRVDGKSVYWVPTFSQAEPLDPETVEALAGMRAGLVGENATPSEPVDGEGEA